MKNLLKGTFAGVLATGMLAMTVTPAHAAPVVQTDPVGDAVATMDYPLASEPTAHSDQYRNETDISSVRYAYNAKSDRVKITVKVNSLQYQINGGEDLSETMSSFLVKVPRRNAKPLTLSVFGPELSTYEDEESNVKGCTQKTKLNYTSAKAVISFPRKACLGSARSVKGMQVVSLTAAMTKPWDGDVMGLTYALYEDVTSPASKLVLK